MVSCCLVWLCGSLLDNEPVDVLEFGSLRRQNRSYVLQINGQHAGHRFRKRLYHVSQSIREAAVHTPGALLL